MTLMTALVLWAGSMAAAFAQTGDDDAADAFFTMDVAVGLQGYAHPNEALPVVVDLTSEELLVGRIDVTSGGSTVRTEIEVPANGAKQYIVYGSAPGDRRQVVVRLVRVVDGTDEELTRESIRIAPPSSELLVGLLGVDEVTTAVRSASTTPIGADVVPLSVDGASLTRGGGPLGYLVVGSGAATDLSDDATLALTAWVQGGGRLVGSPVALERFAPAGGGDVLDRVPAAVTRFGSGELIAVADLDALSVDEWSVLLRDVPPLGLIRTDRPTFEASGNLVAAATAGREASVPALPWLLGAIALFIVLVGPVNFLLLRRVGKPEWAWATVPALSIVFVAAFWFIGRGSLQAFTVTTASIVVDDGLATSGTSAFVVQVERGGTHDLTLPDGWQPGTQATGIGIEPGTARVDEDGSVVYEFELDDLGVGAAEGSWRPDEVGIDLTVTASGREIAVDAANETGLDFWAWGVVVDGVASASADPLPNGTSGSVSVRTFGVGSYSYEPVISAAVQRRLFYVDEFDSADFSVVTGLAGRAQADLPPLATEGVFFFGFTDDSSTPVRVDSIGLDGEGTTLIIKRGELDPAVFVAFGETRPDLLSVVGASTVEEYGDGRVWAYGAEEVTFGYVLPIGVDGPVDVDPGGSQFEDIAVFDWAVGEYVDVEWGDDLSSYVSAGGEVVLRTRPSDARFFEEGILLSRYAIEWEPAS